MDWHEHLRWCVGSRDPFSPVGITAQHQRHQHQHHQHQVISSFEPLLTRANARTHAHPHAHTIPLQGWNSWCTDGFCNLVGKDICNEALVKSIADSIVSQGMDKLGYHYVNLDDCWSLPTRNATGHLQADPTKFPNGLGAVTSYVHSKGLSFGLCALKFSSHPSHPHSYYLLLCVCACVQSCASAPACVREAYTISHQWRAVFTIVASPVPTCCLAPFPCTP
jgi:hypothetical protein